MRVTSSGIYQSLNQALNDAASRAARAQNQLATGVKVAKASDSPVDASQLLRLDSQLAAGETYKRSITDASSWLATVDGSTQDMLNILGRAEELSLSALNGSRSLEERQAIAAEIRDLRDQLASSANANYLGQAVFAGHSTEAITRVVTDPTTTPPTVAYNFTGTVGEVNRQVDDVTTLDVSYDGMELLGFNDAPGKDAFSVLTELASAIDAPVADTARISAARVDLGTRSDGLTVGIEAVGARVVTLERLAERLDSNLIEVGRSRSAIGEIDLAKAMLDVQTAKTSYEAALAAVAKATLPSLADYLR